MNGYGELTLGKLYDFVMKHPKSFPKGFNTKITSGDFEGNYLHEKYELMKDGDDVVLCFELHESY